MKIMPPNDPKIAIFKTRRQDNEKIKKQKTYTWIKQIHKRTYIYHT